MEISEMTTPPDNWQDGARFALDLAASHWTTLTVFVRAIRIALAEDDYQAYQEALLWVYAEEAEP